MCRGDSPATPLSIMSSTSLCLDGTSRSALLLQARTGNCESLARLILPYAPGLYLGALRLTRNPADAEDVRQDAFLKVMTRLEQFVGNPAENRDDLHAWVSRIAANAVRLRLFRAHRKLREKLSVSLQPGMRRNSPATMAMNAARRGEERKSDQRISLRTFAECPCGD